MEKVVVLLSSGLDSTVNLFEAVKKYQVILAVTFDYGQRAAPKETHYAKKICQKLEIQHKIVDVKWVKEFGKSALVDNSINLPTKGSVKIDSIEVSNQTAKSVWVPNRNGIFLNIAAGFAESLDAKFIIPGFNFEEAQTFPDNTQEFLSALDKSFSFSTSNKVATKCFTTQLNKTQIVKRGVELGVPWDLIWPCYQDLEKWCRECESCQRALRAFSEAGVKV